MLCLRTLSRRIAGHAADSERDPIPCPGSWRAPTSRCRHVRDRLVDLDTFAELATLQAPETRSIRWLCFSRDRNLLAAACANQVIQLWDLRHLRQELAARGLDWHSQP